MRKSQQNTNVSAYSPIIIKFCISVLILPSHLPHTIQQCKRSVVKYSETVLYKTLCHDNRVLVFTVEETFGPPSSSPDEYFPYAVPPRPRDTAPLYYYYVLSAYTIRLSVHVIVHPRPPLIPPTCEEPS